MACTLVKMPTGGNAFVCGPARKCKCGNRATLLCDWKTPDTKSGTCDKPLCRKCTTSPATDKDLCPDHAKAWEARKAERREVNDVAYQQGEQP